MYVIYEKYKFRVRRPFAFCGAVECADFRFPFARVPTQSTNADADDAVAAIAGWATSRFYKCGYTRIICQLEHFHNIS